jgi:alkanesulfonate monooxygenase SsuD/methylene tetrahydromethanopterin reductase-like flavin-dependent oxidoreductase (luciferase family)
MKIGLRLPQTDEHRATKENIIRLATEAENAGFDSLWVLERLIWPMNPQNVMRNILMHMNCCSYCIYLFTH